MIIFKSFYSKHVFLFNVFRKFYQLLLIKSERKLFCIILFFINKMNKHYCFFCCCFVFINNHIKVSQYSLYILVLYFMLWFFLFDNIFKINKWNYHLKWWRILKLTIYSLYFSTKMISFHDIKSREMFNYLCCNTRFYDCIYFVRTHK